nr:uncharacterized protein LOC119159970 [Rhipicephalus microplus]
MKCPMHSTRFLARLVLAAVTISGDISNEEESTDSYYYSYQDIDNPALDAFTPRKDVTPPTLNLSGVSLESGEYGDLCFVDGLRTPYGAIPVNCTESCLSADDGSSERIQPLPNDTLCIVMSKEDFKTMEEYNNVSCLLGACKDGNCVGDTNCTWCYKTGVTNMGMMD